MPARDNTLIPLISEVLIKCLGIGANELYEAVSPFYYEKNGSKLHRPHFYKYLGIMRADGLVGVRDSDKRGKPIELYLTEIGRRQYHQKIFELPSILGESSVSRTGGISQELKALYAIILYFNQGVSYRIYTEGALDYILKQFGLSMSSLFVLQEEGIIKSKEAEIQQVILKSPKDDAIVYKETFLHSDIHERGTVHYRCFLRGITCEAILEHSELRAFRHFGFTSGDIRKAFESLSNLDILKPMGALGLTVANEVIYKIDKSIFDFMFELHSLNGYDIFDKIESIMTKIWFKVRPPTADEKNWLDFVYGKKEADAIVNGAHDSRKEITNGDSMNSYISKVRRNDKKKLIEINKRIDAVNKEISKVKDDMEWIQELYEITVDRHKTLLKSIFEIIYPKFFASLTLESFGLRKIKSNINRESNYAIESIDSDES